MYFLFVPIIVHNLKVQLKNSLELADLSAKFNPILRGWENYYTRFYKRAMTPVWNHINYYFKSRPSRKKLFVKAFQDINILNKTVKCLSNVSANILSRLVVTNGFIKLFKFYPNIPVCWKNILDCFKRKFIKS
ncbi:MAG: group II intron maturase-specific domain-containing protein [Chlorobium sp.]